jgi:ribosomal protein L37E
MQWSKEKYRQYNGQRKKVQTIQWPKEKDRQYNGQKKKTDNTMVKRKRQTIQ